MPLPQRLSYLLTLLRKSNLKTEHLAILLRLSQIEEASVYGLAKTLKKSRTQIHNYLGTLADKGLVTYAAGAVRPRKVSRAALTASGQALLRRL